MKPTTHLARGFLLIILSLSLGNLSCMAVPRLFQNGNQNTNQGGDIQIEDTGGAETYDVTGIWESDVDSGAGTVSTELILEPTGTFSQTVTWNELITYDTGQYTIVGDAIHFTVTNHEPKVYKGQPMSYVTSFTYFITPIDDYTIIIEDHIANTQWEMYRSGP
jgi:hypothetical protein